MAKQKQAVERRLWRKGELAEAWNVSRWTISRLVDSGELAVVRVGHTDMVEVAEADAYLARHRSRAKPKAAAAEAEVDLDEAVSS